MAPRTAACVAAALCLLAPPPAASGMLFWGRMLSNPADGGTNAMAVVPVEANATNATAAVNATTNTTAAPLPLAQRRGGGRSGRASKGKLRRLLEDTTDDSFEDLDVGIGEPMFVDDATTQVQQQAAPEPEGDYYEVFQLALARGRWGGWGGYGWGGYGGPISTTNIITAPAPPPPPPAPPAVIVSAAFQTALAQQAGGVSAAATNQQASPPQDCVWGPWSTWSACTGAPGQEGLRYRSRVLQTPALNGGACVGTSQQAQRCISGSRP